MSWEIVKLGDVVKMVTGKTPPTKNIEYFDGEYLWVNPSDFGSKFIIKSKRTISQKAVKEKKNILLPMGTILLSCIGDIGKIGILKTEGSSNQQITGLITNDKVYPDYLYYYLMFSKSKLESLANKAVVAILNNERLRELDIPLPPLATQKRIAEILDAADALKRKDQQLLKKYDELAQAIFIDMFGDPVKNEKGWEVKKLGSVTKMNAGDFIPASEINSTYNENLNPCYGGNGLRGFVKSFTHDGSHLLIGRQGALCGNVKIASGKFHATEHAIVCTSKIEYNVIWLYFLLGIINLNKFATGAAQPGLNVGNLEKVEIIFAPLNIQNQFAETYEKIKKQNSNIESSFKYNQQLFNTLIQKAFNGELVN